ncbi:MAG: hypothetical protein WCQ99_05925, partial [Pseudomonadota bacterium]
MKKTGINAIIITLLVSLHCVDLTYAATPQVAAGYNHSLYAIPSGTHLVKFLYSKDYSVSSGLDVKWIDRIVLSSTNTSFTTTVPITTTVPPSTTTTISTATTSTPYTLIKGTVRDNVTGQPIVNAVIGTDAGGGSYDASDSNGQYWIGVNIVYTQLISLSAIKEGYINKWLNVTVYLYQTITLDIALD